MEGQRIVGLAETLPQVVFHHDPGADDALLGGLADQHQGAGPLLPLRRHQPRRTHQAGNVDIVAAGVHHECLLPGVIHLLCPGGIGQAGLFLQRQTIHVRAHHHQWPRPVLQQGHHPGAADTLGDLEPRLAQFRGQARSGLDLHAGQLGILVEMGKQRAEVTLVIGGDQLGEFAGRCRVGEDSKAQQEGAERQSGRSRHG